MGAALRPVLSAYKRGRGNRQLALKFKIICDGGATRPPRLAQPRSPPDEKSVCWCKQPDWLGVAF